MGFQFEQNNNTQGASIKVIGVGGAGCNAVNTMLSSNLNSIEFIVANTDRQALDGSMSPIKIQIGENITKGLGAGAKPEIGRDAATENREEIKRNLEGTDMLFIAAGMGGGTGTGAAPVIAEIAKEVGVLTVGVVTKPFAFEGKSRIRVAEEGLKQLKKHVDSLIVIPNEKLFSISGKTISLLQGFKMADEVLLHAIKSISDLINVPGLINLDFADVKTIMASTGMAFMGIGEHSGENRAAEAAQKAISNPLLDDISIKGAKGILVNITGSKSLTFADLQEATDFIQLKAHEDANIIFGAVIDDSMADNFQITVIATGFENIKAEKEEPEKKIEETPARPAYREENQNVTKLGTIIGEFGEDDTYDTPTFVRKQQAI